MQRGVMHTTLEQRPEDQLALQGTITTLLFKRKYHVTKNS